MTTFNEHIAEVNARYDREYQAPFRLGDVKALKPMFVIFERPQPAFFALLNMPGAE